MKFICDEMLGTLAKWLRIMGYDTEYAKGMDDEEIISRAAEEGRAILTRDKLLARKGGNSLYIGERKLEEQIRKVIEHFNLDVEEERLLSRCTICNVEVEKVEKGEVREKVPEHVWQSHDEFWRCPKCGRIYWMGSHWDNMKDMLEKIKNHHNLPL